MTKSITGKIMLNLMKSFFLILLYIVMFFYPSAVFQGACNGLLLWFNNVFPTLFPFIIISSMIIKTNTLKVISKIFGPLCKRIFHVSEQCCFAIIGGFLCGYPMGARITADLVQSDHINYDEANYLLSFCNNTSPIFVLSYILIHHIQVKELVLPGMIIFFLSPCICSLLFYTFYYKKNIFYSASAYSNVQNESCNLTALLDSCIMNGIESITQIGGYIVVFSVLINLVQTIIINENLFHTLLLGFLEITNGITCVNSMITNKELCWLLSLCIASFGGFCAVAQTGSMVKGAGLSMKYYIIEKLITTIVTSLLAFMYLTIKSIV